MRREALAAAPLGPTILTLECAACAVGLRFRVLAAAGVIAIVSLITFGVLLNGLSDQSSLAGNGRSVTDGVNTAALLERLALEMESSARGFVVTRDDAQRQALRTGARCGARRLAEAARLADGSAGARARGGDQSSGSRRSRRSWAAWSPTRGPTRWRRRGRATTA